MNAITAVGALVAVGGYLAWHLSRLRSAEDRASAKGFERGRRTGYEEAYVEVWNAIFHGGSLVVHGPKGTSHEGETVTILGSSEHSVSLSGQPSSPFRVPPPSFHPGMPLDRSKLS